jgi:hypothetical protein
MPCCHGKIEGKTATAPGRYGEEQCLECAEKHLGYAWEIQHEMADGYAGYLRVIGNLYAAEKHTVKWPALHAAIRAARKAWQAIPRRVPAWQVLERQIAEQAAEEREEMWNPRPEPKAAP